MAAWVLEAPGKAGSARRLAWLEGEYARLCYECHQMETLNADLNRQLEGALAEEEEESEAAEEDVTSPEQVHLEGVVGEGSLKQRPSRKSTKDTIESFQRKSSKRMSRVEFDPDEIKEETEFAEDRSSKALSEEQEGSKASRRFPSWMGHYANAAVMKGSALGKSRSVQAAIYFVAFCGVVFVLVATATHLGVHAEEGHGGGHGGGHGDGHGADDGSSHSSADGHAGMEAHGSESGGHGRRLGGAAPALLKNIAFSLVGAGLVSFIVNMLKQPLIIGYLLGGILVGPIGLGIVQGYGEIDEIAELGALFLLFMIGMELDFNQLARMDRVTLVTGFLQFPVCAGAMSLVFLFLQAVSGLHLGTGEHPILYTSLTCSVSSTMIVMKVLAEKFETESPSGRLTVGILIFQDIWAIVILAVQPTFNRPHFGTILRTFAMITVLIVVSLSYAKFVMPPVLYKVSKSVELMLVLSLSWCFFICSAAILPFMHLSMELAAVVAGTALATFPYSNDFNSKIKYIRDFFITLFFAGVGMQVPLPTGAVIGKAILVAIVVLAVRWLGIFALVLAVGGEPRLGAHATINLSQISEFALVICSMGIGFGGGYGHIESETMTIVIWAFGFLAVFGSYAINVSHIVVRALASACKRVLVLVRIMGAPQEGEEEAEEDDILEEEHRDILLFGFHKVASLLIAEFQVRSPQILKRIHLIDINPGVMANLREKGVKCTWGDFASAKDLTRCHPGEALIVMSTIPDSLLHGVTNLKLLKVARDVWPNAHFIATADNPYQAQGLYEAGADYVVRMAKLCAARLHELLTDHCTKAFGNDELQQLFEQYKTRDKDAKGIAGFLSLKV